MLFMNSQIADVLSEESDDDRKQITSSALKLKRSKTLEEFLSQITANMIITATQMLSFNITTKKCYY